MPPVLANDISQDTLPASEIGRKVPVPDSAKNGEPTEEWQIPEPFTNGKIEKTDVADEEEGDDAGDEDPIGDEPEGGSGDKKTKKHHRHSVAGADGPAIY
jgi:hypothetical protein